MFTIADKANIKTGATLFDDGPLYALASIKNQGQIGKNTTSPQVIMSNPLALGQRTNFPNKYRVGNESR